MHSAFTLSVDIFVLALLSSLSSLEWFDVKWYLQQGYDSRDGFNYYQIYPNNYAQLAPIYTENSTNANYPGRWVLRANRLSGSVHIKVVK